MTDSPRMLYKRTQARKKYPLNCALMMSPRMVTKRLQANCQARRTDQQPINVHISKPAVFRQYIHLLMWTERHAYADTRFPA
ncbi:hypothetical protein T265_06941 [Opisthorchis viverrini]|uniref:Uncharacterized protein n=1 Tax=Opisthorchis viverrini TaxID=6198 RepID=A0A074ZEI0_OPIVI|nr:hypothetical protein T265_06941 [Opisthorchis viverrini]KER25651.1 hypothetical protein T265_06941 [Opisthorchis viverrini]